MRAAGARSVTGVSRQSALDVGVLIFNSWGNLARGPHKSHSSLPLLRAAGWATALVAQEHLRSILPTPPVSSSWAKRFCSLPAQPFLLKAAGKGAATFLLQGWITQAFIFMPFSGQFGRTWGACIVNKINLACLQMYLQVVSLQVFWRCAVGCRQNRDFWIFIKPQNLFIFSC